MLEFAFSTSLSFSMIMINNVGYFILFFIFVVVDISFLLITVN